MAPPFGNSNYHAVNLRVEKRYAAGCSFNPTTPGAARSATASLATKLGGGPGTAYSNIYNRQADRAQRGNHISHRWISGVVYDLPWGAGRRLGIANPAARGILGSWTLGYIGELRSGQPIRR